MRDIGYNPTNKLSDYAFEYRPGRSPQMAMRIPPWAPNLNAYAERWVRAVKEETLSQLILFEEHFLWHALMEYTTHYHRERPHQGYGKYRPYACQQPET